MDGQPGGEHGAGDEPGREPGRPGGVPDDGPVPGPDPAASAPGPDPSPPGGSPSGGPSGGPEAAPGTGPARPAEPAPPGAPGPAPAPDPRLAGFAAGGQWDLCPPSAALAAAVEAVAGPQWRCPGASGDQLAGVVRRLAALESWASAGRLGVIREMIRHESPPYAKPGRHGDLPDAWPQTLGHELAVALGISAVSADAAVLLAWDLRARLPGIGARLADGTLSYLKVMLIVKELSVLSEDDAAKAEALILGQLAQAPGLTPAQLGRLAAQAAVTVDPGGAERRREAAEQLDVRVRLWREQSGAAAIAGRNLPTDEALAAYASVNARTGRYKKSKAFPGASMDQLRAMAYLDLLNGITADERIASAWAKAAADAKAGHPAPAGPDTRPAATARQPARNPGPPGRSPRTTAPPCPKPAPRRKQAARLGQAARPEPASPQERASRQERASWQERVTRRKQAARR
jgi:hypothetical protein